MNSVRACLWLYSLLSPPHSPPPLFRCRRATPFFFCCDGAAIWARVFCTLFARQFSPPVLSPSLRRPLFASLLGYHQRHPVCHQNPSFGRRELVAGPAAALPLRSPARLPRRRLLRCTQVRNGACLRLRSLEATASMRVRKRVAAWDSPRVGTSGAHIPRGRYRLHKLVRPPTAPLAQAHFRGAFLRSSGFVPRKAA